MRLFVQALLSKAANEEKLGEQSPLLCWVPFDSLKKSRASLLCSLHRTLLNDETEIRCEA